METDELLNAFLILLLSGAARRVLTWLSKRSLGLPHLLVHPGQTQPERRTEEKPSGVLKSYQRRRIKSFMGSVNIINIQCDDISVGLLYSYAQRVLTVFIAVILCSSSFQE